MTEPKTDAERIAALEERVAVLERLLLAQLAAVGDAEQEASDPLAEAFLRHQGRARKAQGG